MCVLLQKERDQAQTMLQMRRELKIAEEDLRKVKDELTERDREVSGLNEELQNLQEGLRNLQALRNKQERTVEELQNEREKSEAQCQERRAGFQLLQEELSSSKQAHQAHLSELREKMLHLQQKLALCTEEFQTSYYSLLQYKTILEKQTCDLEFLHQRCLMKEEEVTVYEEMMENRKEESSELQEKPQESQGQVIVAESKICSLEDSLVLYKKKYQTALTRTGLLEGKIKSLEEELMDITGQGSHRNSTVTQLHQDLDSKSEQLKRCKEVTDHLTQELQATLKNLALSQQSNAEKTEIIQGLQNQLAASGATTWEFEKRLLQLQVDFASYRVAHRFFERSPGNQTEEESEELRKLMKDIQEELTRQSQRAEEYQSLVQDLRTELEKVTEQKKNIVKDVTKQELELHELREKLAAQTERKRLDLSHLELHVKKMDRQLGEVQGLCLEKDQALRKKNDSLQKAENKVQQLQGDLQKKDLEVKEEQSRARDLEVALQKVQEEKEKRERENSSQIAEIQLLKEDLQEALRHHQLTSQQLAKQKEGALLAEQNWQTSQKQLRDRTEEGLQLKQAVDRLEAEGRTLREEVADREKELEENRKLTDLLKSDLSQAAQKHQSAVQESIHYQHSVATLQMQLGSSQEQMKVIREQLQEQEAAKKNLQRELEKERSQLEALQRTRDREKDLGRELETLQLKLRDSEQMLEEKVQEAAGLRAELLQTRHRKAQLEEETAAYEERMRRLNGELKKLQSVHEQSEHEVQAFDKRMGAINAQVLHWQKLHQEQLRNLTDKEEEIVLCKVEMASLNEKLHAKEDEVEALRTSLRTAQTDSQRLHREIELVVANVYQWVKGQKEANEILGQKVLAQTKHIAQLSCEKDHLHRTMTQLQHENKQLRSEVEEKRMETEQSRVLRYSDLAPCPGQHHQRQLLGEK
ncbi:polyamine-modulated factor 1-binding protein 1 isoform X3 [Tachyglossus aculeatus]|uniref:polyamine-modulated factor 1-binding protein 1 isoform X3 n=1 Tax=Tachyglossus aculeatus TaxID=9261 RepID=UPI0018F7518E|nr:polyamine-modulated factor 1-binding protein 1 isoform X3 [Tachyglossus aculeatus]